MPTCEIGSGGEMGLVNRCPGVKLGVVQKVGGSSDVPRCEIVETVGG